MENEPKKPRFNAWIRIGTMIAGVSLALVLGSVLIKYISVYLLFGTAPIGAAMVGIGFYVDKKKRLPSPDSD